MKSCPACHRTFEDTFTFCLADGSLLSAPLDPGATQRLPAARQTDPAPTESLYPAAKQAELTQLPTPDEQPTLLPPTIASPGPILSGPDKTSLPFTQEQYQSAQNAAFAAEVTPAGRLTQTHSIGGKRWAMIVGGVLAVIGIGAIIWLVRGTITRTAAPGDAQSRQVKQTADQPAPTGQSFTENINGVQIEMVAVPGGSFLMGSPLSETGRDKDEGPQNEVSVQNFYLGKDEVTQAQYQAVMGTNPSSFKGDDLPVDSVSWSEAVEFCRKLSKMTGHEYRLPTEAEWEYAARAGTGGADAGDVAAMAWEAANSGNRTHPVGQKQPNGFGLYDMYGNVWEWCQSKYQPYPYNAQDGREELQVTAVRVMRGGAWESAAIYCRSAYRRRVIPDLRSVGFRIILTAR